MSFCERGTALSARDVNALSGQPVRGLFRQPQLLQACRLCRLGTLREVVSIEDGALVLVFRCPRPVASLLHRSPYFFSLAATSKLISFVAEAVGARSAAIHAMTIDQRRVGPRSVVNQRNARLVSAVGLHRILAPAPCHAARLPPSCNPRCRSPPCVARIGAAWNVPLVLTVADADSA